MPDYPVRIELRISEEIADALDDWRAVQRPIMTRQDAIRALLEKALKAKKPKGKKGS